MKKIINILISLLISILNLNNWRKPKKKEIIIYDKARTKVIEKYLDKKDYVILNVRYKNNNSINFYIIFKILLKFKLNIKTYKNELINEISPKFVISMIDNNHGFYTLKKTFPNIKFIMIQFAWRQNVERIIPIEFQNKKNEINSYVDYFIVFNETIKKEFQKYIKANYLTYGSFTSNSFNINTKNLIYKYLLVGQTANSNLNRYRESNQSTVGEYLQPDFDFYKVLIPYILKEKNEKINILAKSIDITKNTLNFYNDLVGENNFNLIDRTGYSYEIIDKSEIIIGTTSTLLYEALSRGKKTAIFSHKSKIKKFENTKFGWPAKIENKGCFWTDSIDIDEIKRVVNFLTEVSDLEWKKILNNEFDHILKYDKNNEKFINFAKSIKMPIN